jgi:hypothetical protein
VIEIATMSDLRFLPQTLMLYRSVSALGPVGRMTVICMDGPTHDFLDGQRLSGVELIELSELERADPAMAATRSRRDWTEYCWTVTPAMCAHLVRRAAPGTITAWIDADVEFVRDPNLIADALEGGSVLLTPHRYNRAYPRAALPSELAALYGSFNGGTIAFRHDKQGLAAAQLWRERTLEWCRDECEPGRYGNQLHLEDFPQRFDRTRVLPVPGGVLGPWNGGRFRVRASQDGPVADGRPVIAYHYQSLRLGRARPWRTQVLAPNVFPFRRLGLEAEVRTHYRLSRGERRHLWRPYLARLQIAVGEVLRTTPALADTLADAPDAAQARATIRLGLTLRLGRLLPLWHAMRARLIALASQDLARALRRRERQLPWSHRARRPGPQHSRRSGRRRRSTRLPGSALRRQR